MIVLVDREELLALLEAEIRAWESVDGGANPNAYEFDIETITTEDLHKMNYYLHKDSWTAGIRVRELKSYVDKILSAVVGSKH